MALTVCYGGTFDPVHHGHLQVARAARDALAATIRLMPAPDPPHRAAPGASAEQRAAMLDLAVAAEPGLVVDRREFARSGRSYSIDTLRELRAELGAAAPIALLIGADSLLGLPDWHAWRALFELTHFIAAERPGSPLDGALPAPLAAQLAGRWTSRPTDLQAVPAGRVWRLRQPQRPESATELRRRIQAGEPWRDGVPAAVADYIEHHGLYRGRGLHAAPL